MHLPFENIERARRANENYLLTINPGKKLYIPHRSHSLVWIYARWDNER